ncbi:transporter [Psychroserpens sp. Hel_I_66]|uniref:transporter n=1 Tax=Psychroserpens sp. Hel_I_66 TaxID=1250004 RepID=UPI00064578A7|nr:transporter [Psychroserpens sp. Hel_I_66]
MKYILIIFCLIFSSEVCSQGPIDGFYRGQKNVTTVLGFGYEDNKDYLIGKTESDLERTLVYGNIFVAYGLSEHFDVQVSLPYMTSDDNSSLQDISFFSKYKIGDFNTSKGNLQLSLGLGLSTPLGNYEVGGLNDLGQRATILDMRAMLHHKWNSNWFVTLQSGYSLKFEEVPNSIPLVIKAGKAAGNWYYDVFFDFQNAVDGIDYRGTPRPQNFRELEVDYQKLGATVYRNISGGLGVYLNYSNVIGGRNVFQGPRYGVGLVYDFRK